MWYLTDIVLNTEGENRTKIYTVMIFFVNVTLKNVVKVISDFHFWLKFNRKWNFHKVTCDTCYHMICDMWHMQASRRNWRMKTRLLWFVCWTWIKIGFQWISNLKNDPKFRPSIHLNHLNHPIKFLLFEHSILLLTVVSVNNRAQIKQTRRMYALELHLYIILKTYRLMRK